MAAATAISKIAEMNIAGGRLEYWKFTLDPGSLTTATQEVDTIAVPGAKAGDPCFVTLEAPTANIEAPGAKVTADNVVSVYVNNPSAGTVDGASMVGHLQILKRTVVAA